MLNDKVKVTKNGVTKTIQKKDLPDYISLGWVENKTKSADELKRNY